jgi:2-phospho-L-lactate guanylyltransferase
MTVWAIIPASPLEEGKSRLAEALNPAERYRLNRAFFRRTLETAAAVIDRAHILVVSRSAALLDEARALGVHALPEAPPHGLNQALGQAAGFARAHGADAVLSISCDLPFLTQGELRGMLDVGARGGGLAVAGDRSGTGTNALMISPVGCIPYCYGPGSFAAHRREAAGLGRDMKIVRRAGLSFDIDTPDDFEQMEDIMRETLPVGLAASVGFKRAMFERTVTDAA